MLYQEYIRKDLINPANNYNPQAAYRVFASPMVEFSMISGLAILWGEFIGEPEWRNVIELELQPYKDEGNGENHDLLPKIISVVQSQKVYRIGIGNRDLIQTEWEQSVSAVMRKHPNYKVDYGDHFDRFVNSKSKIFTAFSRHHLVNFDVLEDTEEVFLVMNAVFIVIFKASFGDF